MKDLMSDDDACQLLDSLTTKEAEKILPEEFWPDAPCLNCGEAGVWKGTTCIKCGTPGEVDHHSTVD